MTDKEKKLQQKLELSQAEIKVLKLIIKQFEQGMKEIELIINQEKQKIFENSVPEDEL